MINLVIMKYGQKVSVNVVIKREGIKRLKMPKIADWHSL